MGTSKILQGAREALAIARGELEPARISHFHYVRHDDVPRFEAVGWALVPTNLGPTHGQWSVLMKWTGEGEPVEPAPTEAEIEAYAAHLAETDRSW